MTWTFNNVMDVLSFAIALVALVGIFYIARAKAVLNNYRALADSQERRIRTLIDEMEQMKKEVCELKVRDEAHRDAARIYIEAVASSGVCAIAPHCPQRVIPKPKPRGF